MSTVKNPNMLNNLFQGIGPNFDYTNYHPPFLPFTMIPSRRKRPHRSDTGITFDDQLEDMKRLKINDDTLTKDGLNSLPQSEWEEEPVRIVITPALAPTEDAFRRAVLADFSETCLAKLLNSNNNNNNSNSNSFEKLPEKTSFDDEQNAIVVYQPSPLSELLKQAAYSQEHQMQLD